MSKIQVFGSVAAILVCGVYGATGYQVLSKTSAESIPSDTSFEDGSTLAVVDRTGTTAPGTPAPKPTSTLPASAAAAAAATKPPVAASAPQAVSAAVAKLTGIILTTVYTTAYTYFDNTPAGSADIAFPHSRYGSTIHNKAGGTGTYNDPITLAVGHVITGGKSTPDFAPGTRFYFPDVRKYAIVEDICGDGGTPQDIPCHNVSTAAHGSTLWLDIWIGGSAGDDPAALDKCAGIVTDSTGALHTVVKDPSPNYAVVPGAVYQNGYCIQPGNKGFGNTLIAQ